VLDNATNRPTIAMRATEPPNTSAMAPPVSAIVKATCASPPGTMLRHIRRSSFSENSMPAVNSSSATPISARMSTFSCDVTRRNPLGPATTPATIRATIDGTPARAATMRRMTASP
jgi:hypothetical protein